MPTDFFQRTEFILIGQCLKWKVIPISSMYLYCKVKDISHYTSDGDLINIKGIKLLHFHFELFFFSRIEVRIKFLASL